MSLNQNDYPSPETATAFSISATVRMSETPSPRLRTGKNTLETVTSCPYYIHKGHEELKRKNQYINSSEI